MYSRYKKFRQWILMETGYLRAMSFLPNETISLFNHFTIDSTEGTQKDDVIMKKRRFHFQRIAFHGFTLLELMVVLVILGLLAGMVSVRTRSYLVAGKQNTAKVEIAKIVDALEAYYAVYNHYPTNEEGLAILASKSEKFPDGLLNKVPVDPWGNPYVYNYPGKNGPFEIMSYGADGQEGGEGEDADIVSET